jgi:hypothetical protein
MYIFGPVLFEAKRRIVGNRFFDMTEYHEHIRNIIKDSAEET